MNKSCLPRSSMTFFFDIQDNDNLWQYFFLGEIRKKVTLKSKQGSTCLTSVFVSACYETNVKKFRFISIYIFILDRYDAEYPKRFSLKLTYRKLTWNLLDTCFLASVSRSVVNLKTGLVYTVGKRCLVIEFEITIVPELVEPFFEPNHVFNFYHFVW